MRINRFIAAANGLSRRSADQTLREGRVLLNGRPAAVGDTVTPDDTVVLDGKQLRLPETQTILLHKPTGYVTSREGQGAPTVYDLLPVELQTLKPVGRLDKDSSGLLLMTNDGDLAHQLTHPSFQKIKQYAVHLDKPLQPLHRQMINDHGLLLEDGVSRLTLERLNETDDTRWRVIMHEGRNRQIRRTFASLGYTVTALHRSQFGNYQLGAIPKGQHRFVQ